MKIAVSEHSKTLSAFHPNRKAPVRNLSQNVEKADQEMIILERKLFRVMRESQKVESANTRLELESRNLTQEINSISNDIELLRLEIQRDQTALVLSKREIATLKENISIAIAENRKADESNAELRNLERIEELEILKKQQQLMYLEEQLQNINFQQKQASETEKRDFNEKQAKMEELRKARQRSSQLQKEIDAVEEQTIETRNRVSKTVALASEFQNQQAEFKIRLQTLTNTTQETIFQTQATESDCERLIAKIRHLESESSNLLFQLAAALPPHTNSP